ncbi:MAG: HAMP domain-containing sensor histidine kinase [Desulfobacterales bacterium]
MENEKSETENQDHLFREIQIEFLIHELKDPIAVIDAGARLLLENRDKCGALTARQEKVLQRILRSAKKAEGMLHDILETGRSKAGCFSCCRFKLDEALYEVLIDSMETILNVSSLEQQKKFEYKNELVKWLSEQGVFIDIAPGIMGEEIEQDEIKFRQIAGNLFKNALYYRTGRVEIKLNRKDDFLILNVADDGPGIEPEDYQNVFKRYVKMENHSGFTRKGHGIGLAGALVMARSLGGNIEIESRRGKGAKFTLIFPVSMKAQAASQNR